MHGWTSYRPQECFSGGVLDAVISIKRLYLHLARPLLHFRVLVNLVSTSFPCRINRQWTMEISTLESPEPINNTSADMRTIIACSSPKDTASGLQLITLVHADQVDGRTILLHRFELRDLLWERSRSECMSDYTVRSVGAGSGKSVSHRWCRIGARLDRKIVSRPRRFAVVINRTIARAAISPRACRRELGNCHRAYFCYKTRGGTHIGPPTNNLSTGLH